MELSEAQRLAVETRGKNVCVSAGAGSGKTRVLVERFLYLVTRHGISPAEILAITFTEKAANEMKRRIVKRLGEEKLEEARREVENAAIGTIHSFCARLLREHPVESGVDPHFSILESSEAELLQEKILEEVIEAQANDAEVFNLLRLYEEKTVSEGILNAYRRSRNSETSFEEILRRRIPASRASFQAELRRRLAEIPDVNGVREVLESEDLHSLETLRGSLRASGKQKEAIHRVKETLDDFASFLAEEESLPQREVFIRLALQFEKAYEAAKRSDRVLDFDDLQLRAVRLLGSESAASKAIRKIYQEKFSEILVDEFQDTNRLQDRLIEFIRREPNLFIVGDFKQSIYGFRGTQVEIFLEKEKAFRSSATGTRISLAENYRARPRLIDFVNPFSAILWKEDGIPFEWLQAIRLEEGSGSRVEWLRLEQTEEEGADDVRIREARTLAHHIRSLVEKEGFRYQEIALLFKAMSDVHFYEQAFRRAGIPYYVVSSGGFYAQPEIRDMVSFLSALENSRQDVPLAATLRSPLFQISDETLFSLARRAKQGKPEAPLMEGIREFESIPEIREAQKEKLRFFHQTFEHFLKVKEKLRISELVEQILRITDFDLYVLKGRPGERRFANLRKLVELAREVESKESIHLGDFVRWVKGLETREVRESQAQVEAEAGNVVRLLSIHMAKGLEFPVVILPDLGRAKKPEGEDFLISEEGLGIKGSLTFRRNKARLDRARSEESKRLFYVAMTRAKERLVLSGPQKTPDPKKDSFHALPTWADWVERILGEGDWDLQILEEAPPEPFPFERRRALAERKSIRSKLERLSPIRLRKEPEGIEPILENLASPEPVYFQRIDLPVSAFLLFAKDPEEYFRVYEVGIPQEERREPLEVKEEETIEEEGLTSAEFGTRVHQILEQVLIRFNVTAKSVGAGLVPARHGQPQGLPLRTIDSLVFRCTQDLDEKERDEILEIVRRFAESAQAKEIFTARAVYPELPFVLRLPHGLVQGTMDLVYQNRNAEWILLDYKTGAVDESTLQARGEEYRIQLELYALALWKILGVPPREAHIHFLRPSLTYRISFSPSDFENLFLKFTGLQRKILDFRKAKQDALGGVPRGW